MQKEHYLLIHHNHKLLGLYKKKRGVDRRICRG